MVKVPAIITLAVTILRLVGELMDWNETFFGSAAGGGNAVIGISWLVAVFGFLFGRRIRGSEGGPGAGTVAIKTVIAIAVVAGGMYGLVEAGLIVFPEEGDQARDPEGLVYILGLLAIGVVITIMAWPKLGWTLLIYAILARIPVVIITWFAVDGNWDTHYSKLGPGMPEQEGTELFITLSGVQVSFWIALTVIGGALCGALGSALASKSRKVTS